MGAGHLGGPGVCGCAAGRWCLLGALGVGRLGLQVPGTSGGCGCRLAGPARRLVHVPQLHGVVVGARRRLLRALCHRRQAAADLGLTPTAANGDCGAHRGVAVSPAGDCKVPCGAPASSLRPSLASWPVSRGDRPCPACSASADVPPGKWPCRGACSAPLPCCGDRSSSTLLARPTSRTHLLCSVCLLGWHCAQNTEVSLARRRQHKDARPEAASEQGGGVPGRKRRGAETFRELVGWPTRLSLAHGRLASADAAESFLAALGCASGAPTGGEVPGATSAGAPDAELALPDWLNIHSKAPGVAGSVASVDGVGGVGVTGPAVVCCWSTAARKVRCPTGVWCSGGGFPPSQWGRSCVGGSLMDGSSACWVSTGECPDAWPGAAAIHCGRSGGHGLLSGGVTGLPGGTCAWHGGPSNLQVPPLAASRTTVYSGGLALPRDVLPLHHQGAKLRNSWCLLQSSFSESLLFGFSLCLHSLPLLLPSLPSCCGAPCLSAEAVPSTH